MLAYQGILIMIYIYMTNKVTNDIPRVIWMRTVGIMIAKSHSV